MTGSLLAMLGAVICAVAVGQVVLGPSASALFSSAATTPLAVSTALPPLMR